MAVGGLEEPVLSRKDETEQGRLQRLLGEAQARLEEQAAYYRGELEATRQRIESQHLRLQADEVAKRRRAEEQVLGLKADLRQAQEDAARAKRRYDELARQLLDLEESSRLQSQTEIDKVRAAAKAAWRGAEEELARIEDELTATRKLLTRERERCRQLEETLHQQRSQQQGADVPDPRLVASLKKALWATAQARRRAEAELAAVKTAVEAGGDAVKPAAVPRVLQQRGHEGFEGTYRVVASEDWKQIVIGEGGDDIADEFHFMAADGSLGELTATEVSVPLPPSAEPPPAQPAGAAPVEIPEPTASTRAAVFATAFTPAPVQSLEERIEIPPRDEPRQVRQANPGLRRVVATLAAGGAVSGLAYWLLVSGWL